MAQQPTPEQMKELQEKLKGMSPEELREFQKKQCIFCHIISGKVQSKKVYEDEHCLAILDINPSNPGHVLLMPKEHYAIMPQLPQEILEHLFLVSKKISNAQLRSLGVGTVDWRRAIDTLKATGYDSTITLEIFCNNAAMNYNYLDMSRKLALDLWAK